jgi:hypothetical protein
MRIVAGRRDLDDYHGLPGARGASGKAKLVSLLMMSAISLGASFGALSLVKEALNRTLGADTVNRALRDLDPADSDLFSFIDPSFSAHAVPMNFAQVKLEEFGRRAFGQRKTPPPEPAASNVLTTFRSLNGDGFAPSTSPLHAETNAFAEASRLGSGPKIQVVAPTARSS